jgi:hypothetical protein
MVVGINAPPMLARFLKQECDPSPLFVGKTFQLVEPHTIHLFFNFVMNYAHRLTLSTKDPGYLLSSTWFQNASCRRIKVLKLSLISTMVFMKY